MIKIDINKKLYGSCGDMSLDIDINIANGEFITLSGKSGSGKTTLLRILAGLEKCDGKIVIDNEIWQDDTKFLAPQKREIGFLFQDYALFENMSVEQNLLYVSNDKKLSNNLLSMCELEGLKDRLPKSLSGGQKQRVALCRAMMRKPKLLLLDEPFSALDETMRKKLQTDTLNFHKKFNTTTIMVSHDPIEIYKLSSRVIYIDKGKIIKDGSSKELLMKTKGSQKLSFDAHILDIKSADILKVITIAVYSQIVEVTLSQKEAQNLKIGDKIKLSAKAFSPTITKV